MIIFSCIAVLRRVFGIGHLRFAGKSGLLLGEFGISYLLNFGDWWQYKPQEIIDLLLSCNSMVYLQIF